MLEFYFKHYEPIATRYVIFDDGSTDRSLEILKANSKVEIRPFPRLVEDSYILSAQELHNTAWKESRGSADWVIMTAVDEHLVHPDLTDYLMRCLRRGVTLVPSLGYQMISDDFPEPTATLNEAVACGAPFAPMSKLSIFQPSAIRDTDFAIGRHSAEPVGRVIIPLTDEVLNLHYKYLNFDRVFRRHKMLARGLGSEDKRRRWGHRYGFNEQELAKDFVKFQKAAVNLHDQGARAPALHAEPRWWRERNPSYPVIEV